MKIAFIMPTPFNLGGEQRVVTVVSNILTDLGYDIYIICTETKVKENREMYGLNNKVKVIFTRNNISLFGKIRRKIKKILLLLNRKYGILKKFLFILKYINSNKELEKEIINLYKEYKFDVMVGVADRFSIMLANIAKNTNAKLIGWQHSCYKSYFETKGIHFYNEEKLVKYMFATLDDYIVLSNLDKQKIKNKFNFECKTIYNPKSFELSTVSNLKNKVFLAAGRLEFVKGFDMLIEAFKIYKDMGGTWKLKIVGEGSQRENLQKMIDGYNLSNDIKLEGYTSNIIKYFLNASTYLLTSRWEGFGLVVIESFEAGLPVITFDIDVMKELINNGENGILVPCFDINKFAMEMYKVDKDSNLRNALGSEAKKTSYLFSYNKIAKIWEEILNN